MLGDMQNWEPNVASIIEYAGDIYPKTEVVSKLVNGSVHRTNYGEIKIRSRKLGSKLVKDGYKPGDILATLALNTHRHLEAYYGISGIGAITHTLNFRLHPEQAVYIINHAEDKVIFVEAPFIPLLEALQDKIPSVEKFIVFCDKEEMPETSLKNCVSYEEYIEDGDDNFEWPKLPDDAACGLCYTSGTTGNPKGVLYSHKSTILHAISAAAPKTLKVQPDDSSLVVVPMFHVMAWGVPYYAPMYGIKIVMPGMAMDGQSLYEMCENEKVTIAFGVPTVWMQLLGYCRENNLVLNSMESTVIGGSAVTVAMIKEFDQKHNVTVIQGWGMTEMSPLGTTNFPTPEMDEMPDEKKYALQVKAGRPVFGVEMKIVDDKGATLPNDGVAYGRLLVRGPWIIKKYFKSEESAVDADNWFDTGDISSIDPDGYMAIVDREKDVIKSGGEWISSIDLENVIANHPDVLQTAVVGIPHPKWDERPLLFIVSNSGNEFDRSELDDLMLEKFEKWQLPDDVVFLKELPIGATGKVKKIDLRQEYTDHYMKEA
tara:strand:- start:4475 stop:6100 length:1626 start_codon:yes stop_codon:yes gene_type:complete